MIPIQLFTNLRDAVTERLGRSRGRCVLGTKNDFDLCVMSEICCINIEQIGGYLHRLSIDLNRVQLLGSRSCGLSLTENDSGDTNATTVLVVVEKDLLDGSNRLSEVFLKARMLVHIWRRCSLR